MITVNRESTREDGLLIRKYRDTFPEANLHVYAMKKSITLDKLVDMLTKAIETNKPISDLKLYDFEFKYLKDLPFSIGF